MGSRISAFEIDTTDAPPNGGREHRISCRYLSVLSVPPGCGLEIRLDSNTADPIRLRRPAVLEFEIGRTYRVWFTWTQLEPLDSAIEYDRAIVELVESDHLLVREQAERVEVIPCPANSAEFDQARVTNAGTAVQLGSIACEELVIKALASNTGKITVGNEDVTNTVDGTGNGFVLEPGESMTIPIDDPSRLWINATVNNDGVCLFTPGSRR